MKASGFSTRQQGTYRVHFLALLPATIAREDRCGGRVANTLLSCARRTKDAFPSIYDPASVLVSVVVPAYNEEKRITTMMDEMLDYLRKEERKDKCVALLRVA